MVWANKKGHKYLHKNSSVKKRVLILPLVVGLLFFVGFLVYQSMTSLYLSPRDRITVAVLSQKPYVLSYEKSTGIVHIVYFNPDTLTYVPGGYGWYRLGSVRLLAHIEHNNEIMLRTVSYLIGAPVDGVFYEKKPQTYSDDPSVPFMDYFLENKKKHYQKYDFTKRNLIDSIYMPSLFQARISKLVPINARDFTVIRKGKRYYEGVTTDPELKGFFYQPLFLETAIQLIVKAPKKNIKAGRVVARIAEGVGMKVIAIEPQSQNSEQCVIRYGSSVTRQAQLLSMYFKCRLITDKKLTSIVYLQLGSYDKLYL